MFTLKKFLFKWNSKFADCWFKRMWKSLKKQEGIPVGCVLSACADHTCLHLNLPPDVTSRGVLKWKSLNGSPVLTTRYHYQQGLVVEGGPFMVRRGFLYSEVQCMMGNGHMEQMWLTLPLCNFLGERKWWKNTWKYLKKSWNFVSPGKLEPSY